VTRLGAVVGSCGAPVAARVLAALALGLGVYAAAMLAMGAGDCSASGTMCLAARGGVGVLIGAE
jgi:hypothetical protein